MKKPIFKRCLSFVASIILLSALFITACDSHVPRIRTIATYSPGAQFATNFNTEDMRRQVKCTIIFEVIDEFAVEELEASNFIIRNAVLSVLGELTELEVTTERDLDAIATRIVERVNVDLDADYDLIIKAYFTDFVLA